jgi:hypothetical protein
VRSFISTSSVGCSAKFVKMRLFTRNIIHQDQRLKKLEENPNESNVDRSQSEKMECLGSNVSLCAASTIFLLSAMRVDVSFNDILWL